MSNKQLKSKNQIKEKLCKDLNPKYLIRLNSKDAQTFISDKEAEIFEKDLYQRQFVIF